MIQTPVSMCLRGAVLGSDSFKTTMEGDCSIVDDGLLLEVIIFQKYVGGEVEDKSLQRHTPIPPCWHSSLGYTQNSDAELWRNKAAFNRQARQGIPLKREVCCCVI